MTNDTEIQTVLQSWDRLLEILSARTRREIIRRLSNAPTERRLPLPEAATIPGLSADEAELSMELQHHHLPMMAEAGYVRWSAEPFCVQRGPRFEEPATVFRMLIDRRTELPESLWNETLEEVIDT